ncbi:MAG TPA: PP2C family protein-serine/threonine phosphatase [Nocardioidaceae bacterium]|nr:PP2C family protein-serine/threonine phosphatase [Nocardioidaceae bacterium]
MRKMSQPGALQRVLEAAEDASPVQAVEAVTRELRVLLGASSSSFLLVDLSGRALVRLAHTSTAGMLTTEESPDGDRRDLRESAAVLPFDGGPAEQALRSQTVQVLAPGAGAADGTGDWTVLAPVTERGEAIGLLEMVLAEQPDAQVVEDIRRAAHALAFVVIANRRHTDLFEWGQRSVPFSLAAEIQRRLLPAAFTCEAGAFTLAAWLEPAARVGGDTFDYSLARDVLHLSVTDAMGHGTDSALTATVCVGSLRNSRRMGSTLLEQVALANECLVEHAGVVDADGFATGLIGRLDLRTGRLSVVNAGHVAPYLLRDGEVTVVELPADVPLGMFPGSTYRSTELALQPGDRLVLVTDGMLERNAANLDLSTALSTMRAMHPREATRSLADAVLAVAGTTLADDATMLVLDWHGGHHRDRVTTAGADDRRASSATVASL